MTTIFSRTRINFLKWMIGMCVFVPMIFLNQRFYKIKLIQSVNLIYQTFPKFNETVEEDGKLSGNYNTPHQTKLHISEDKRSHLNQDKIVEYYTKLGIKINKYSFPKVFSKLSGNEVNTTLLLKQIEEERINDSEIPQIMLKYPNFEINLPNFICEEDKQIFLKLPINSKITGMRSNQQELKGHLGVIYKMASMREKNDCGWKNKMSDFSHADESVSKPYPDSDVISNILVPESNSFQHFIDGALPKLVQLLPFLNNSNLKFLVLRPRDYIVFEMLAKLGITRDRLIFDDFKTHSMKFQLNGCIAPPIHPIIWDKMRDIMGVTKQLQVPISNASVILLTRIGSRNGGRNIMNKQEVINYLNMRYKKNFVLIQSVHNFKDSLRIFGKARIVIGVHGGALYNLNFCPKETIIIEYQPGNLATPLPNSKISHTIFWAMTQLIGQKYYRVMENHINVSSDLNISIAKLKKLLDQIDEYQKVQR